VRPTSAAPAATPTATEVVSRPDPGLARGKWEAPAWAFWALLAIVLVGAAAYVLHRLGLLRLKRVADTPPPSSPPSSRMRRP
jgi:hypothetical protein